MINQQQFVNLVVPIISAVMGYLGGKGWVGSEVVSAVVAAGGSIAAIIWALINSRNTALKSAVADMPNTAVVVPALDKSADPLLAGNESVISHMDANDPRKLSQAIIGTIPPKTGV